MVTECEGVFLKTTRGQTGVVYISSKVVTDSTFPFKLGERMKIRIDGNRVVLEKRRQPSGGGTQS